MSFNHEDTRLVGENMLERGEVKGEARELYLAMKDLTTGGELESDEGHSDEGEIVEKRDFDIPSF